MSQINKYIFDWIEAGEDTSDNLFSQYVRIMRQRTNLSREQLAHQLGMEPARLVALENGLLSRLDFSEDEQKQFEDSFALSYRSFVQTLLNRGLKGTCQ
ncbi:helix-turn-helix domain-containing protein [Chloroflexi bacterium TSY]|nr:helix-turn-helix domain-containing protein [Chloroflexi bacterium TSY]